MSKRNTFQSKALLLPLLALLTSVCLSACSKTPAKVACLVPIASFSQKEKDVARANLDAKRIPVTEESVFEAIESKDDATLKDLIKLGVNLNGFNSSGNTPLTLANQSTTEIVRTLINGGANVNMLDRNDSLPLMLAVYGGNGDTTGLLLEHCATANVPTSVKREVLAPMQVAIEKNRAELVKLLLKKGAGVNHREGHGNLSPLHNASTISLEIVTVLVENGADVREIASGGWTPLIAAMNSKKYDVAKYLIAKGADVKSVPQQGMSALQLAKQDAQQDIVDLLVSKGATQ